MTSKKSSGKKGGKKAGKKPRAVNFSAIRGGTLLEYGDPIRDAVARGDANELRKLATVARKQIRDVEKVLQTLERSIDKAGK
jgi:hypothetical protein